VRAVGYHPEARLEFLHEVAYYTAISRQLGESFDKAIEAAEQRAVEFPDLGSPYRHRTRRVFPKKFPFSVVYVATDVEVFVLAIAPDSRKPGYWKARRNDG
jgi:toxin ParE1/3/4